MSTLERLKEAKGFREHTAIICDMEILFIEPSVVVSSENRKNFLKFIPGNAQDGPSLNMQTSDLDAYNRGIVVSTAYDPETRTPLFKNNAEYDSLFGKGGNLGEAVLSEFLAGAKAVMRKKVLVGKELIALLEKVASGEISPKDAALKIEQTDSGDQGN